MFVCQLCGGVVPLRTPATRVVVHRRPKRYPLRREANRFYRTEEKGKRKLRITDDPGGVGWEIAREVLACPACAMHRQSCGQAENESGPSQPGARATGEISRPSLALRAGEGCPAP